MRIRTAVAAAALASGLSLAPTHAATTVEEKRALEPGGSFVLEAATGSVKLTGTASSGANVVIRSRRDDFKELYDVLLEEKPGAVHVTIKRKNFLTTLRGDSMEIEVQVPRATQVEIQTSGGSIDVEDIDRDAKLRTSGGSVDVERLGGNADVKSSGGSLKLSGIAGDIRASTSGGTIRIDGAGGRVSAETSGGSIETRFAAGNARGGELETSGGGVRVYVDPSIDLTLNATTTGGSVTAGFPVTVAAGSDRASIQGAIGKGGETLRIRSSGGSIRLEKL